MTSFTIHDVKAINIHEAKTHLSRLISAVNAGEDVVIAKAGRPMVRLVPFHDTVAPRVPGKDRGTIRVPEDFDHPLPDGVLAEFES